MRNQKLLDEVRRKIRLMHYSYRTEEAYIAWIKRYVHFHELTHPQELGDDAIEEFLSDLATRWRSPARREAACLVQRLVRRSRQNQCAGCSV